MQREIKERQSQGRCFTMEELTHLLYNMIESGSYLQQSSSPHGDVRPCYAHITERGNFKLGDRMSDGISVTQNQLNIMVSGKHYYMSPSLFTSLKKGVTKVSHNIYKSDVFSLGLVLLEAGLVRQIQSIYDDQNGVFCDHELEALLDEFGVRYPDNPL